MAEASCAFVIYKSSIGRIYESLIENGRPLYFNTYKEAREKRRLLSFVLSNCTWADGEVIATFRQPFDLLAETAAAASRQEAQSAAIFSKTEKWLPGPDSNQRPSG